MISQNLLLYVDAQFASPYAMSVFVALHEKGLSFEIATVDLVAEANQEPQFAALSLTRRVPTLVHDGFALSESSAICEYLDETFPGTSLYPIVPRDRARARQVQAWLRSDLVPIREERPTQSIFFNPATVPLSSAAQASAEKLFSAAAMLLSAHAETLFDQWCIADVDLALMLNRLVLNGDPVPATLAAYAKYQWQRPAVQLWVKHQRR